MKALLSARTLAASLGVLAVGALAASPAMAFDKVKWEWEKKVKEYVDIDAYIDLKVDISGMVEVEKLQIFLGDAKAESYVKDIINKPYRDFNKVEYTDKVWVPPVYEKKKDGYKNGQPKYKEVLKKPGHWDYVKVTKLVPKALDATVELPIVVSVATAVGNNQSITSDVPVFLHDGQFVADVKEGYRAPKPQKPTLTAWNKPSKLLTSPYTGGNNNHSGNAFTDLANDFLDNALDGKLKHADITAKSKVEHVRNVSVDSSATAVANNISANIATDRLSDHVLIGDITQFALANVSAKSTVTDVKAEGYYNMRKLTTATLSEKEGDPGYTIQVPTPWVSSVATAVGNNVSINVGKDLRP